MKKLSILLLFSVICLLTACVPSTSTAKVNIAIIHDGSTEAVSAAENSTVEQAITASGVSLSLLDRVEPDKSTIVSEGLQVKIVRVTETFVVEESTLPFESQTVKNESLAAGQTILIQAGRNGIQSVTYRVITEDGVELSRTATKAEILQAAQPEIIMVGMQSSFQAVEINGLVAYISSSNAWLMEANTGNRRALVSTGDLDGRIFSISPDREWLLYSRSNTGGETDVINTLWVVNLSDLNAEPFELAISGEPVKNVVHYAEWVPGKPRTIAFSTVESRSTAPGWQANNDLQMFTFSTSGVSSNYKIIIGANPGGIYGWWGTIYKWSPDASEIAYARPDGVGLVDASAGSYNPLVEFSPYNTQGDWAWVPGISWADDHSALFTVIPSSPDTANSQFDLNALVIDQTDTIDIKQDVGLFSYPVVSATDGNGNYQVAYLSAAIPDQSETSRYSLWVMDRDGSNDRKLYPNEGIQGLDAQEVVWSPISTDGSVKIAFVAQGNLLFVNPATGQSDQITGDGSISRVDWK
jgi:resuscitation-promoting factor RpfB